MRGLRVRLDRVGVVQYGDGRGDAPSASVPRPAPPSEPRRPDLGPAVPLEVQLMAARRDRDCDRNSTRPRDIIVVHAGPEGPCGVVGASRAVPLTCIPATPRHTAPRPRQHNDGDEERPSSLPL